jgi:uncharacterized protein (TIGR02118 family)
MATISVLYPREQGATFDFDYYETVHLPLAARLWGRAGLVGGEGLKGVAGPGGAESPYFAIGLIHFASAEALGAAMTGEHAAEIMGDIPNFTNVTPIVQINEKIAPRKLA